MCPLIIMCCYSDTYRICTERIVTISECDTFKQPHHETLSVQTALPLHLVRLQGNGVLQHED